MVIIIDRRRIGAFLVTASLLAYAAHSSAERIAPSASATPPQQGEVDAVDFEAEVAALPKGAERTEGLEVAMLRAGQLADEARRSAKAPPEAPLFVQKIAAAMRARIEAMAMLAKDETFAAGEAGLRRAAHDLDFEAEAALAEHARDAR